MSAAGQAQDDDLRTFFTYITSLPLLLAVAGAYLAVIRDQATGWLLEHHAVIPAADPAVLLAIPATGVGVDGPRAVIGTGLLLILIAGGIYLCWLAAAKKREGQ